MSLKAFASKQPAERLREVLSTNATWLQVHLALWQHGLTLHKGEKGGYTVGIFNSELRVKASDVFRFTFSGKEAKAKLKHSWGRTSRRTLIQPSNLSRSSLRQGRSSKAVQSFARHAKKPPIDSQHANPGHIGMQLQGPAASGSN